MIDKQQNLTKTILIAEDEFSNYQYLLHLLDYSNVIILYATTGQQAIELCKANPNIDLILMDIKMPIMDGYTATKLIKLFRPQLPIIAQTAYALEIEKAQYIDVFDDYLTKPISKTEFDRKVSAYIVLQTQ